MENKTKAKTPKIINMIKQLNAFNDTWKIRARPFYDEKGNILYYKTYLDHYIGRDKDGKQIRKYKYFAEGRGLYLIGKASTLESDMNILKRIEIIRDEEQESFLDDETGVSVRDRKKENLFTYIERCKKQAFFTENLVSQLKKYTAGNYIKIDEITPDFCEGFRDYLLKKLKPTSALCYYVPFKYYLNRIVKDGILQKNPAIDILIKKNEAKREYLSEGEIQKLIQTDYYHKDVCYAFLFSCFTGLRYSDIVKLRFVDIKDGYIEFKQQKTSQYERFLLSQNAMWVIDKQQNQLIKAKNDFVFELPSLPIIETHIKRWVKKAGIEKYITFHCARHTFATMQLSNNTDIFTVSKLLGHRDLKTTQKYAKLINKKLDEAIEKQPIFEFDGDNKDEK